MEQARNAETGETYDAATFERKPNRDALRHTLVCRQCGADAYFVRRSRNGRAAHFGARPHNPGCDLGAGDSLDLRRANLPVAEMRTPLEDELLIRRADDDGSQAHVEHDEAAPRDGAGRARRHTEFGGEGRQALPSRGLRVMLARLTTEEATRNSTKVLHLFDGTKVPIRNACVHFNDVNAELRNRYRLYWGTVREIREGKEVFWANTGRRDQPSVRFLPEHLDALLARARVSGKEDLAGASLIIWAALRFSEKTEKWTLFVSDMGLLDVIRPAGD